MAVNERCILTWDRSNERMNKKPFTEKRILIKHKQTFMGP